MVAWVNGMELLQTSLDVDRYGWNGLVSWGMEQCLSSFCFVGKIFVPWLDLRVLSNVLEIDNGVDGGLLWKFIPFSFLLDFVFHIIKWILAIDEISSILYMIIWNERNNRNNIWNLQVNIDYLEFCCLEQVVEFWNCNLRDEL